MVDGLLLRNVGTNARRSCGLKVLRRFFRVLVFGAFLFNMVFRGTVCQGGRYECGLALVNGGDGLVSVSIGSWLYFGDLQDGMLAVKYLRRVFSALHRMWLPILGMSNVAHVGPSVDVGNDYNDFHLLVVSFDSDLSARRGLVVFSCLRFCVQRRLTCQAGVVADLKDAESNDHEFYRSVACRRVGAREVGRLAGFVKCHHANDQGRVAVFGAGYFLRR